jgi:hypothetical protein
MCVKRTLVTPLRFEIGQVSDIEGEEGVVDVCVWPVLIDPK